MQQRPIPSSGELLPVIGLGTWQTFDVRGTPPPALAAVLERFCARGGKVIDTSPMYGRAEEVLGALKEHAGSPFLATKVWIEGRERGIEQMERSMRLLRSDRLDLIQVHNLLDWRTHLATLRQWQESGRVRYVGVTHYRPGAFAQLETILRDEKLDFVQLPYSIAVPQAEERLLPLAAERGVAVVVNRPFEEGSLTRQFRGRALPPWATELGAQSWSEVMLRWILSHPAVTCAIPATRNPEHVEQNMRAGEAAPLDAVERSRLRKRILSA